MKKTLIALAVLAISGSAFACEGNSCSIPSSVRAGASVSGSNAILSGAATSATSTGNGASYSYASNTVSASTTISATADALAKDKNCDTTLKGAVSVGGSVDLRSESVAFNVSTGTGTGLAAAGALATGSVSGHGSYLGSNSVGTIGGFVAGEANANLASGVLAGRNQGGVEVAVAGASFSASSDTELKTTGACDGGRCVTTGDTKVSTTVSDSGAYSGSATYSIPGLANAASGSLVNAGASSIALGGAVAHLNVKVKDFDTTGGHNVKPPKDDEDKKPKGNNGWGNGDQTAPGNSGGNNNAENGPGKNGKGPK
jgi:hypothetical protein